MFGVGLMGFFNFNSSHVIHRCGQDEQGQKTKLPVGIKKPTRPKKQSIALQFTRPVPVKPIHKQQKQNVMKRGKKHRKGNPTPKISKKQSRPF
jgi:hypothetical protein